MGNYRKEIGLLSATLVLLGIVLLLCGCTPPRSDKSVGVLRTDTSSVDWKGRLDAAETARSKAIIEKDKVAQLYAEKDELLIKAERAESDAKELRTAVGFKVTAIGEEILSQRQNKLYWFSGILGFAALIGAGVVIWFWSNPMLRKLASGFAVAAASVASLAIFFAWMLPYLWWVGCAMVLAATVGVFIAWKRDNKALHQVVAAVGKVKDQIPNFKNTFGLIIDSDVDKHVDAVRTNLGEDVTSKSINNPLV